MSVSESEVNNLLVICQLWSAVLSFCLSDHRVTAEDENALVPCGTVHGEDGDRKRLNHLLRFPSKPLGKTSILLLNPRAVCRLFNPPIHDTSLSNGRPPPKKTVTTKDGKILCKFP